MAKKKTIEYIDGVPIVLSKRDYLQLFKQYIYKESNKNNNEKTLVKTRKSIFKRSSKR